LAGFNRKRGDGTPVAMPFLLLARNATAPRLHVEHAGVWLGLIASEVTAHLLLLLLVVFFLLLPLFSLVI